MFNKSPFTIPSTAKESAVEVKSSIVDGRICSSCGQHKAWNRYNKKSNGINGYDSRCKVCINKAKKSYRRKKIKRYVEAQTLRSVVIGSADKDKVDLVGRILATSIMTLIDNGKIR